MLILTISISPVACERCFSNLKHIKNPLHSNYVNELRKDVLNRMENKETVKDLGSLRIFSKKL